MQHPQDQRDPPTQAPGTTAVAAAIAALILGPITTSGATFMLVPITASLPIHALCTIPANRSLDRGERTRAESDCPSREPGLSPRRPIER